MIYVASSWRNKYHESLITTLKDLNDFNVYDYRYEGFSWSRVTSSPIEAWSNKHWKDVLNNDVSEKGFQRDMEALNTSDIVILVHPSGNSAHMELGYACAMKKKTCVFVPPGEPPAPDLMHKMTSGGLKFGVVELCQWLYEDHLYQEIRS